MVTTPEPTASPKAETLSNSSNGNNASTSANAAAETAANSSAGSSGISAQDRERLTKLGVLLVNVGAASEEKVFGVKGSSAMQTYINHAMSDLLVINRKEDDAAAHPLRWYKPWTWWTSGPQVSPIVRVAATRQSAATPSSPPSSSSTEAGSITTTAASGTQTDVVDIELPPNAETKVKPKKKRGLPAVDMRPLTDDEVAALTPAVREDRAKMLTSEAHIHKTLQNIEDARYRYLVPSRDLHCEAEVVAVVRCYSERHQTAAAAAAKNGAASSDSAHAANEKSFAERADLLACGPDVQRLKKCAESMAMTYSHGGEAV